MGLFVTKKHSIGKTIAELRKEKGWTQIELAKKLQVSDKAISKWEKDNGAPSVEFFPALAELFGVSIDYIMTGKKPEPEIITMSKIELCAKNDDIKLLDGINCQLKDENGKTIIDYILQYKSYKVFVGLCEQNKQNISNFSILDAIKFSILSNRLDLLRGVTLKLSNSYVINHCYIHNHHFDSEKDILELLPKNIKVAGACILTDDFFEMIACDDRIDQKTMSVLLGNQKNRNCVWYHVFPYLIHQSYLHNKTDMLKRLLAQSNRNNEYAYHNMKLERNDCGGFYRYIPNFFFIGDKYNKNGHGLVRVLEETIKLALERGDFDSFEKFNSINLAIINYYDFKPYIASDYEIKMAKLKADKSVSKEEILIQSTIHDGVVNLDELLATKDLKLIKKVLDTYPIHPIEIISDWFFNKNWRELFKYAIDNKLNNIADYTINQDIKNLEISIINLFYENSDNSGYPLVNQRALILRNSNLNKSYVDKELMLSRYSKLHKCDINLDKIVNYIKSYKQQVISDISNKLDKEKTINDLTKEYFETELAKGNAEIVIVKLCVRLEAVLRSTYHYEGDFSEMLNQYCNAYGFSNTYEEDDDGAYNKEAEFVNYLQRLRKCRNSIVHSENKQEKLSIDEIRYCIDFICNMN